MPHADNPVGLVNLTGACKKYVLPTLYMGPGGKKRAPESFRNGFATVLFVKRMDAIPVNVLRGVLLDDFSNGIWVGAFEFPVII